MVLSKHDLRAVIDSGHVAFDPPLEEVQYGEASVDLRLGFSFTKLKEVDGLKLSVANGLTAISRSGFWNTHELAERDKFGKREAFCLEPREFVLAMTHEKITIPNDLIGLVEGRSTYARVGLSMHQTAPWIQPGWSGQIVLEIMNNGPLSIELTPLVDRPCQLTFFKLSSPLDRDSVYGSRPSDAFQNQEHPLGQGN